MIVQLPVLQKLHLNALKDYYDNRYQKIKSQKDRLINELENEMGKQYLYNQKMKFHNKSLEALVLNSESSEVYRETPVGYMQKAAPIYKEPDFANGRAHFLASQKNLFGFTVDTFPFNVSVIWLMSAFLYIALYYSWLRNILQLSNRFKNFNRRKKKIHKKPVNGSVIIIN